MFPLVPYHALPKLHNAVKDDCATPYPSLFSAWREIVPTILKQVRDPGYHVKRQLPAPKATSERGCPVLAGQSRCRRAGSKLVLRPISRRQM